jgi:CBS domain-containing membrane protein
MMKLINHYQSWLSTTAESFYSAVATFISIFILMLVMHYLSIWASIPLLALAPMGATAYLLFVVPHSPMSQPWPAIAGHALSATIGVACALYVENLPLAAALAVALSVYSMHLFRCIHPPGAATAMIAVLGGAEVHVLGWQFSFEVVTINVVIMVLMSIAINNLIPGRRYPLFHTHHPHHTEFIKTTHTPYAELKEENFVWALTQMDGIIDVSAEDLVDLYEFAVEHARGEK